MSQPQYVFNLSNPWQHKDNTKNTTVTREDELYTKKRTKHSQLHNGNVRTNRPTPYVNFLTVECKCSRGCLRQESVGVEVVKDARRRFDKHSYNEQNLLLLNLMDISEGKSRYKIKYFIHNFQGERVEICKTAFLVVFGISEKKIRVVIKKREMYSNSIQLDMRGKHNNHVKLSKEMIKLILGHAASFDPQRSHYTRRTNELYYFDSSVTQVGMYRDFVQKHGLLMEETVYQGSCRTRHINSNVISRKSYIDVIKANMNVQWTKPKTDTCSRCDKFRSDLMYQRRPKDTLRDKQQEHLKDADLAYACCNYDMKIVAKTVLLNHSFSHYQEWATKT